jgi:hypothetical protein
MRPPFIHSADYSASISQAERLAAYASNRYDEEMGGEDESPIVTVSRPPDGFRMPSMQAVRERDALLNAGMIPALSTHEDEEENDEGEEGELRSFARDKRMDGMRDASFRLPSQRSRADVRETLKSMGCSFHD